MIAEAQILQQDARLNISVAVDVAWDWLKVGKQLLKSGVFGDQCAGVKQQFQLLQQRIKAADRIDVEVCASSDSDSESEGDSSVREALRLFITSITAVVDADAHAGRLKQQLLHQLQQCGSAICAALPVNFCCNNLACVNLAKQSEQQLVAGKGSRCSGCKVARYCSRNCQKQHWKQHKKVCKTLQS